MLRIRLAIIESRAEIVVNFYEVLCGVTFFLLNVSVSVFTYCHKKLSKGGGLLSFVSLLWMVTNGQVIDFMPSRQRHAVR